MIDPAQLPPPSEPYRGLEPFRLLDWPIFLERAEEVERLQSGVSLYRALLLYGESGAGKSSLLNAGLLPHALRRGRWPERIRVQPEPGGELVVERIATSESPPDGTAASDGRPRFLPSRFASEETDERVVCSCPDFLARLRAKDGPAPLLIFDQFEELVTLFEEAPSNRERYEHARRAQQAIEKLLIDLLVHDAQPLKIVFSFREDYLAKLTPLFLRIPGLTDQAIRIGSPPLASLRRLIRGPFEASEERGETRGLPGHFRDELDETVTEKLVAGFTERSQSGTLSLSEVQTICLMLWRKPELREALIHPQAYAETETRKSEGMRHAARIFGFQLPQETLSKQPTLGAIVGHLLGQATAATLEKFPQPLWIPAVAVLANLVTPRETRNVISEDNLLDDLQRDERVRPEIARRAIDDLRDKAGIIRRQLRSGTVYYELTSEFSIPWIVEMKWQLNLFLTMRRAMATVGICAAIVLGCAALVWWAWQQRGAAVTARTAAQKEQTRAEGALADAKALSETLEAANATIAGQQRASQETQAAMEQRGRELQEALERLDAAARGSGLLIPAAVTQLIAKSEVPVSAEVQSIALKHGDDVWMAAFFDQDRRVVTASADKFVRFWDAANGTEVQPKWNASTSAGGVTCVAIDPQQRFALSGSAGESVRIRDLRDPQRNITPRAADQHDDTITWVGFDPSGTRVVTTSADRTARIWTVPATGETLRDPIVLRHNGIVSFAQFNADGTQLVTSCDDGFARWWTVASLSSAKPQQMLSTRAPIRRATFALRAGATRVAVPSGSVARLWTPESNAAQELTHTAPLVATVFSPGGDRLAAADASGACLIWTVATQQSVPLKTDTAGRILRLAWAGERLALAGEDGSVEIWHLPETTPPVRERRFQAHDGPVWWLVFSADARRLVTTSAFSEENLPSAKGPAAASGKQLRRLPDNFARVWRLE